VAVTPNASSSPSPDPPTGTPTDPPPDLLAERYGRRPAGARSRAPRSLSLSVGVITLLGVALAGWVGISQYRIAVRWDHEEFTALDDGRSQVRFTVETDPGRRVVCTVRIFNPGLTEVGRTDVEAGPSTARSFVVTAVVPTFELGTSGAVRACAVR
jgi:hypothetical protein